MANMKNGTSFWHIMDKLVETREYVINSNELSMMIGSTDLFWKGEYGTLLYGDTQIGLFRGAGISENMVNAIIITEFDKSGSFYILIYGCSQKELVMAKAIIENTGKSGLILERPQDVPTQNWTEYE